MQLTIDFVKFEQGHTVQHWQRSGLGREGVQSFTIDAYYVLARHVDISGAF